MRKGKTTRAMFAAQCTSPSMLWAVLGVATLGFSAAIAPPVQGAQVEATNTAVNATVRIPRGGQFTLPYEGVTRVVSEDVEVARATFSNGRATLEGVTSGNTLVQIYGSNNTRQLLAVQVVDGGQLQQPVLVPSVADQTPMTLGGNAAPALGGTGSITPGQALRSPHNLSLRVSPVEDNPLQALVTLTYTNRGSQEQDVTVRYTLDDFVSYVTNSATGNPQYDAAARELSWTLPNVDGDSPQSVSFRVEPVDRNPVTFNSVATVQGADNNSVMSNRITYSFTTTPLLTVFALPDRILAGRNASVLVDVRGNDYQIAVDRLQKMGVLQGRRQGLFYPNMPTQRAEYAVMTLKGLNLRDLRDITAIKFVLGRRSTVTLNIVNSRGQVVAPLVKSQSFEPGERTVLWDGRVGTGYAPSGRYTYVCTAKDARGEVTVLKGNITIVPQAPVEPSGKSSFVDVRASDWFAGYLAVAEKQDLIKGYPGRKFLPYKSISRVEATAVVVRALGLEDLARQAANKDVGFLDYQDIPKWAVGYVNVASTVAKSAGGRLIVGYPSNFFQPNKNLRRDEAALIVQRLIDKETNRRVSVSGQLAPGAIVTINNRTVEAADDGGFSFVIEQNTTDPVTMTVLDMRK
jgi:hypothetical protein